MEFTATQIAQILEGEIQGDENAKVNKLSKIEEGKPNTLSFLANPKYEEYIYDTEASIVIVNKTFEPSKPLLDTCTLVKVKDAAQAFSKVLEAYQQMKGSKTGIHPSAIIEKSAEIGSGVYIGANSYIGANAKIGDHSKIYSNAVIEDNTEIGNNTSIGFGVKILNESTIGNNCTIHPGVIIGGEGFGFIPNKENNYNKIPHIGNVVVEDHVEIGCNTTIDRATLGSTIIRKGVKLDNLIQVAHNCDIGENTVIAAQTGLAGSTKIGKNCMIGGQVGFAGHITIADGVKIAAQSGIGNSITEENKIVQGSPAFSIKDYKRSYVLFRNLPDLKQKIDQISTQNNN